MSQYTIPYGKRSLSFDVPDDNFLFYAAPVKAEEIPNQDTIIGCSLDSPIGSPRLEELVKPDMHVAILLDDITRPTPKNKILPEVLARLSGRGIPKENITLVIGLGTHRQMTDEELDRTLGEGIRTTYRLINVDYKDKSAFISLGVSENGTPIEVYREVVNADFKIAIGNIVPHIAAGWGGGAKMIQPGVCSEATTEITHYIACTKQNVLDVCGNPDNLCRMEMEQIAGKVGLDFIINTVLDENKNILGVFSGHYIEAHRAGVALAKQVMCPTIPRRADILIASAYPTQIDFWQGCKPFIFSQYGVRDGGVLIFAIEAGEGLCGNAPQHENTLRKYALVPFEEQKRAVESGEVRDIVGINVPLFHSKVRERVTTICVSDGMNELDKEQLGFLHANTIDEALALAFHLTSPNASVGILPYAGETLVKTEE